jgi:hypothetical protein
MAGIGERNSEPLDSIAFVVLPGKKEVSFLVEEHLSFQLGRASMVALETCLVLVETCLVLVETCLVLVVGTMIIICVASSIVVVCMDGSNNEEELAALPYNSEHCRTATASTPGFLKREMLSRANEMLSNLSQQSSPPSCCT